MSLFGDLEMDVGGMGMPYDSDDIYGAAVPSSTITPRVSATVRRVAGVDEDDDDDDDGEGSGYTVPKSKYKPSKKAKRLRRKLKRMMARRSRLRVKLKGRKKKKGPWSRKSLRRRIKKLSKRITAVKLMLQRETKGRWRGQNIKGRTLKSRAKSVKRVSSILAGKGSKKKRTMAWIRKAKARGWKAPPARTSKPGFLVRQNVRVRWRMWNLRGARANKVRARYWARFRAMGKGRRFKKFQMRPYRPMIPMRRYYSPLAYPQPRYAPSYRAQPYAPVTYPQVRYAPAQPMPRAYTPVIGQERPTSYTYTTTGQRAAAAAQDSAEDAEMLESESEAANEGSSNLKKIGIGLLVVGGIYFVAKRAGKKEKKKPAGKVPAFGG
tara:strand:- start:4064 stop:5200 length:1137 start_codon:yes stop_codon:yes gene_type:complete